MCLTNDETSFNFGVLSSRTDFNDGVLPSHGVVGLYLKGSFVVFAVLVFGFPIQKEK